MRFKNHPAKLLDGYARGVITEIEITSALVIEATESSPVEFAHDVPLEILDRIREHVRQPKDVKWILIRSVCTRGEQDESVEEEERRIWREGLARWRVYFESLEQ